MSEMLLLVEPQIPACGAMPERSIRDRAAADDLVQDCLERAISRWHQWRYARRWRPSPRSRCHPS